MIAVKTKRTIPAEIVQLGHNDIDAFIDTYKKHLFGTTYASPEEMFLFKDPDDITHDKERYPVYSVAECYAYLKSMRHTTRDRTSKAIVLKYFKDRFRVHYDTLGFRKLSQYQAYTSTNKFEDWAYLADGRYIVPEFQNELVARLTGYKRENDDIFIFSFVGGSIKFVEETDYDYYWSLCETNVVLDTNVEVTNLPASEPVKIRQDNGMVYIVSMLTSKLIARFSLHSYEDLWLDQGDNADPSYIFEFNEENIIFNSIG